jgi:hypothetical protein
MKRIALIVCAGLALALGQGHARAAWGSLGYSGYQPWYNIFATRAKCLTPEEERLQKFWHDYYNALKCYYGALDNIDWVSYYKNHGYQINNGCGPFGGGGGGRINYAPVFVSPTMHWAVPNANLNGPPVGPPVGPPAALPPNHHPYAGYPAGN